jgi:hypothetical protein
VYFTVEGLIPGNGANSTDHDDDDDDDHHAVSGYATALLSTFPARSVLFFA